MNTATPKFRDIGDYDIDKETAASREMLEKRIPARLNSIRLALIEIDRHSSYEPWKLALTVYLVESVERNCDELLETFGKNKLPAAAWLARNLLELLVWIKYCGVSRDNAWRFHEDAFRDWKDLIKLNARTCEAMGIEDETAATAAQRIKDVASEKLGLEDVDTKFLAVARASEALGVDLGAQFAPSYRFLAKFAHPTAILVHGITHQPEACRQLQAICTTKGVYYAAQSTLALEAQLGMPLTPD